jgi:hypothetical protein
MYEWDSLPSYQETSNYSFSDQSSDDWFTNSYSETDFSSGDSLDSGGSAPSSSSAAGGGDSNSGFWEGVWDWSNSDQGIAVIGGALAGGISMWDEERKQDRLLELKDAGSDDGPSAAELKDERIKKHNASIDTPMDMGVRKFKKP